MIKAVGYEKDALKAFRQEPAGPSKQPIRTRYLDHVTGYQPIRNEYFLIQSVSAFWRYLMLYDRCSYMKI